jgi:hypothetical protein
VVARTGKSRHYAECLTRLIELTRFGRRPLLSTGAVGRKQIIRRIEAILDATRNAKPVLSRISMSLVAVLVLLLVLQLSRIDRLFALPGVSQFRISDGVTTLEVSTRGDVEFTEDERDVQTMSDDGLLRIEQRQGWSSRRIEIVPGDGGRIERRYFVAGQPRPFDGEARTLLATQVSRMARDTGANVPQRVRRILDQGGPSALLEDIGQIGNDRSRALHLIEFVNSGDADPDQLKRAMRLSGAMHSDSEKGGVLSQLCPVYLKNGMRHVLFEATATMHSDDERRKVLVRYLEKDGASGETLKAVLESSAGMHSDSARAAVLVAAMPSFSPDAGGRRALFEAIDGMHSDSDRRRVLAALLETDSLDEGTLSSLLRSAARMNSDQEKAGILVEAAKRNEAGALARHSYFEALDSLHSDSEKRRAAAALLEHGDAAPFDRLLLSVREIHSDQEKAQILLSAVPRYRPEFAKAFFEAVLSIHSPSEQRKVLIALLEKTSEGFTAAEIAQCAARMTNDQDKAAVLNAVAERFAAEQPVRSALAAAAESVHSHEEYRKLMRTLVR